MVCYSVNHRLVYFHSKQWAKRQRIVHNYGEDDDECDTEELQAELEQRMTDGTVPHRVPARSEKSDGVDVVLGGKNVNVVLQPTSASLTVSAH